MLVGVEVALRAPPGEAAATAVRVDVDHVEEEEEKVVVVEPVEVGEHEEGAGMRNPRRSPELRLKVVLSTATQSFDILAGAELEAAAVAAGRHDNAEP